MNFLKPKKIPFCQGFRAENINKWRLLYIMNEPLFKEQMSIEFCDRCHGFGGLVDPFPPCGRWQMEREAYIITKFKKYFWRMG